MGVSTKSWQREQRIASADLRTLAERRDGRSTQSARTEPAISSVISAEPAAAFNRRAGRHRRGGPAPQRPARRRKWSPATARTYAQGLRSLGIEQPTKADLDQWVIALRQRGLSPGGINVQIRTINSYLTWLHDLEALIEVQELRRYAEARGWAAGREYVDRDISGAKDRRPALDQLLTDARRRRLDVVVCWRLDRLGRNLKHLITLLEELQALGVKFVSLAEGIDVTTPAGKLQMHILGAIAEFERERIRERMLAGLERARTQGKRLGGPRKAPLSIGVPGGSVRGAAALWRVSKSTAARWIAAGRTPAVPTSPTGQSPIDG
jgi:DNA invertase Pin-like site-specific DNA recombinase